MVVTKDLSRLGRDYIKTGYYIENLRLGTSAVQHDMKREETVEEVEKNTELGRQTPNS